MKIQVLGSGCPTCKKFHDVTSSVAKELGYGGVVDYITGPEGTKRIIELGIMSSPVLLVDDTPIMVGFTPNTEKIKGLLEKALAKK